MTHEQIRVFIVDDHPMIRAGLAAMIRAESDLLLVGEAANGADALLQIPISMPDVVMMDLIMPQMDGIDATAALHKRLPKTKFVILTSMVDPQEVNRAIDAGAAGYFLKNASSHELVGMIHAVYEGRRVWAPEVTDAMIAARQQHVPMDSLTPREQELLTLMACGHNNQDIATALSIALPTVKFHVSNILSKLQVDNRTEAVLKALKHKLVTVA